jgi:hypothetical protein
VGTAAFPEKAHAVLETEGTSDSQYTNLALSLPQSQNCAFIQVENSYGGTFGSGVLLNSNWVLTTAHLVTDASGNVNGTVDGVATGTISPSSSLTPVAGSFIFPGFNNSGSGPDLLLLHLTTPINVPALTIGTAAPGSVVATIGYGYYGTPSTGLNIADGNLRAWQATVDSGVSGGVSSTYFQMTDFGINSSGLLNGEGAIGDSGAGTYNSLGQLVGTTARSSGNWSDPIGFTLYNNLSAPGVQNWINATIAANSGNPPALTIDAGRTLHLSGTTNQVYGIQASPDLQSWQQIGQVTNLTGTVTFQDPQQSSFASRFYRAVVK